MSDTPKSRPTGTVEPHMMDAVHDIGGDTPKTHCVEIEISLDLLRDWLELPPDVKITDVTDSPMVNSESFMVRIEHPLLPAWTEGPPPRWSGVFTKHEDGTVTAEWGPE